MEEFEYNLLFYYYCDEIQQTVNLVEKLLSYDSMKYFYRIFKDDFYLDSVVDTSFKFVKELLIEPLFGIQIKENTFKEWFGKSESLEDIMTWLEENAKSISVKTYLGM